MRHLYVLALAAVLAGCDSSAPDEGAAVTGTYTGTNQSTTGADYNYGLWIIQSGTEIRGSGSITVGPSSGFISVMGMRTGDAVRLDLTATGDVKGQVIFEGTVQDDAMLIRGAVCSTSAGSRCNPLVLVRSPDP
jgi:hypothetical protein